MTRRNQSHYMSASKEAIIGIYTGTKQQMSANQHNAKQKISIVLIALNLKPKLLC